MLQVLIIMSDKLLLTVWLCVVRDFGTIIFQLLLIIFNAIMFIYSILPALRIAFVVHCAFLFSFFIVVHVAKVLVVSLLLSARVLLSLLSCRYGCLQANYYSLPVQLLWSLQVVCVDLSITELRPCPPAAYLSGVMSYIILSSCIRIY